MNKTIKFHVKGKVQGVGFRYATRVKAGSLDVNGFVRNCINGDVEGVASGRQSAVDEFTEWLWKGPDFSKVVNIEISEPTESEDSQYTGFNILR